MKKIITLLFTLFIFNLSFSNELGIQFEELELKHTETFDDNIDYKVLYFFSYGCPYCYDSENYKTVFYNNMPDNVAFESMPITATPAWNEYTMAYFIADSLKLDIRTDIFKKIHIDGEKILLKEQLYNFFHSNYSVNYNDFEKRYNSMLTRFKISKIEKNADLYGVMGTPSIVILDKKGNVYKTSPSISGGIRNMMASTIYIIKKPIK